MKKFNFDLKKFDFAKSLSGLAGGGQSENFENTEFRRIFDKTDIIHDRENGTEEKITRKSLRVISSSIGVRKNFVTLVPMKSLSMEEFTFPFSNSTKIREALKLQVMPFTAAGDIEIFPVVTSKAGRGAGGLVWYVAPDELNIPAPQGGNNKVWPAPLPFISKLKDKGGSGITMWIDEKNISSILWQNNKPVMSRWRKFTDQNSQEKVNEAEILF